MPREISLTRNRGRASVFSQAGNRRSVRQTAASSAWAPTVEAWNGSPSRA